CYAMERVRTIITDPECDSLLRKWVPFVPVPEARKALIAWLNRACPSPPPRKKEKAEQMNAPTSGELREQTTALRDQHIAYAVALVTHKYEFTVKQACSVVAEAVTKLVLPDAAPRKGKSAPQKKSAPRTGKSVQRIWDRYQLLFHTHFENF